MWTPGHRRGGHLCIVFAHRSEIADLSVHGGFLGVLAHSAHRGTGSESIRFEMQNQYLFVSLGMGSSKRRHGPANAALSLSARGAYQPQREAEAGVWRNINGLGYGGGRWGGLFGGAFARYDADYLWPQRDYGGSRRGYEMLCTGGHGYDGAAGYPGVPPDESERQYKVPVFAGKKQSGSRWRVLRRKGFRLHSACQHDGSSRTSSIRYLNHQAAVWQTTRNPRDGMPAFGRVFSYIGGAALFWKAMRRRTVHRIGRVFRLAYRRRPS